MGMKPVRHFCRTTMTRRAFLGLAAVAATGVLAVDAVAFAPANLMLERLEVPVPGLPREHDGLRLGLLSDLHVGRVDLDLTVQAVECLKALEPDLVCVAGDMMDGDVSGCGPLAAVLGSLRPPLGVVAVPGNHDYWSYAMRPLRRELAAHGAIILVNESIRLPHGLWLAGLDDPYAGRPDLDAALAAVTDNACVLLLCHGPDYADVIAGHPARIPLQLSGHSHGGQVVLPFIGPPSLPPMGRKYHTGLYTVEGTDRLVYTTRGVGHTLPVRFNCPPEATLLTLRAV